MKRFYIRIIIFSTIAIIIPTILDYYISIHIHNNNKWYEWRDIYNNNINSKIVIFGSSRAVNHYDCKIIENELKKSAYDLGIGSSHMDFTYLRLIEFLKHCSTKPSIITLDVYGQLIDIKNSQKDHYQIFPYLLFNKNCYECTKHIYGFDEKYYWVPLFRYSGYIKSLITDNSYDSLTYKGYHPNNKHFDIKNLEWLEKSDFKIEYTIDEHKIDFFNRFIKTCQEENIELNFVFSPELYQGRKFIVNRDKTISFFKEWADSLKIPFVDFSQDTIFNSDTTLFYNVQHLNKKGAEKFTRELYLPWIKKVYGL